MFGFILIGICVAIETVEQLLYRFAGRNARLYIPVITLAITLHLTGMAFWYILLKLLPLGIALPLSGLSYATIALTSCYCFGEKVSWRRGLGITFIILGFVLITCYEQQL